MFALDTWGDCFQVLISLGQRFGKWLAEACQRVYWCITWLQSSLHWPIHQRPNLVEIGQELTMTMAFSYLSGYIAPHPQHAGVIIR